MRVTRVIREYVEREVNAKFDPKVREIAAEYEREKEELAHRLEALCAETEEKALEIAKSLGFDYVHTRWGSSSKSVSVSPYAFSNEEKSEAVIAAQNNLANQRRTAIENILLSLELGETTKAELKNVIDSVEI